MKHITIVVPERVAHDLTAPTRHDESPTEARRRDAQEEIAELCRAGLAGLVPVQRPVQVHAIKATLTNLAGHVGHNVAVHTSSGVVTRVRCEDCDVEVPIA